MSGPSRAPDASSVRRWQKAARVGAALGVVGLIAVCTALGTGRWHPWRGNRVRGIDVSHHQEAIDWRAVAQDDVRFAYIKATEGGDFVDPRFESNWAASGRAGVRRGAYHFFTRCRSGEVQAANFIRVVPREPDALPHALDLEHTGPCRDHAPYDDVMRQASAFLDTVESHYGRRPVVYTTREFHSRYLTQMRGEALWLRSMLTSPAYGEPWTLWQHSATGRIDGISGHVDLNLFRGDESEFERWAARRSEQHVRRVRPAE